MGYRTVQKSVWALVRRQHGVVARAQLLELGLRSQAIKHRIARGRLHPVFRGVYAVGRAELTQYGRCMAAVLACGPNAALSHGAAGALWLLVTQPRGELEVSVPAAERHRVPGVRVHRRAHLGPDDITRRHGIPVTQPICTLVDLAVRLSPAELEAAVNEADKLGLVDPEGLRAALDGLAGRHGVTTLRKLLDRRTFTLTDSELERRFLRLTRRAGLAQPRTGCLVNGFKVDFYWPDLDLVVETDGLRYHRTPAQQARDRLRDQTHVAAGLTTLRFTHAQVKFEAGRVEATLAAVARRLRLADRGD